MRVPAKRQVKSGKRILRGIAVSLRTVVVDLVERDAEILEDLIERLAEVAEGDGLIFGL